jgi:hypothetical protein
VIDRTIEAVGGRDRLLADIGDDESGDAGLRLEKARAEQATAWPAQRPP